MSKFMIGDRVKINDYIADYGSVMTGHMVEEFGGKEAVVVDVSCYDSVTECNYYNLDIDPAYGFSDYDLDFADAPKLKSQRIEIPVSGGHLVAETCGWGGTYPGIFLSFIKSGEEVEHGLCFAEVCAEDHPDVIRVGTYYRDCDEVKEIVEFPMWKED